jgi:hypothetical protein
VPERSGGEQRLRTDGSLPLLQRIPNSTARVAENPGHTRHTARNQLDGLRSRVRQGGYSPPTAPVAKQAVFGELREAAGPHQTLRTAAGQSYESNLRADTLGSSERALGYSKPAKLLTPEGAAARLRGVGIA